MAERILIIDDDTDYLEILQRHLSRAGFKQIRTETDPRTACALFEEGDPFDIALIDMTMPEMDGLTLMNRIKNSNPNTECIMITAVNAVSVAVDCIRKGAYDYLVKPVSQETLIRSINRALERKQLLDILDIDKQKALPRLTHRDHFKSIATRSRNLLKVLKEAELHARSDVPVLITGESGTGKELLARAIHAASPRAAFPLTAVNMAAVTGSLFDAEFFGHTRGAFTGAEKERIGYLEHTHRGTLFLDEIGIMPLSLQGKLLRVLQNGEYMKIGANLPQRADVRIIAATNEDMEWLVDQKRFRKDLYFRLRGGWLHLPPLRDRKADIPMLISLFLEEFLGKDHKRRMDLQTVSILMGYDYPGNVRELKSIVQSSVNLAQGGAVTPRCLPEHVRKSQAAVSPPSPPGPDDGPILSLERMEREHILSVYRKMEQNKCRSARALGIGLNTLRRRLTAYGVH